MVSTLRKRADALVIVGGVRRPDLWKLRPDWGFFVSLPQILEMMAGGGDDSVLSRVVRFFEAKGIAVRGAHEVAPGLLALGGPAGALSLDRQGHADAELGFAVRAALGPLDAGQAVVVADGRVLAIEGAEGTDAMLRRVADLRGSGATARRASGVLAKGPKPGQELRVDMPTDRPTHGRAGGSRRPGRRGRGGRRRAPARPHRGRKGRRRSRDRYRGSYIAQPSGRVGPRN